MNAPQWSLPDGHWQLGTSTVYGTAAKKILAGEYDPGMGGSCCALATSLRRLCWHQAAAILAANGLRPMIGDTAPRLQSEPAPEMLPLEIPGGES